MDFYTLARVVWFLINISQGRVVCFSISIFPWKVFMSTITYVNITFQLHLVWLWEVNKIDNFQSMFFEPEWFDFQFLFSPERDL